MNARVPCPLCGGPLHPIAGRCKHCKQDLSLHRGRAGGAHLAGKPGSLPQLAPFAGFPAAAAVALGSPAYPLDEARGPARSWLRNWPLLVILLAVIGMIVALLLLVLPQRDSSMRRDRAPLHNDPMDTHTLPGSGRGSSGGIDPWQPGPSSPAPRPPAPDPSAPDPSDPDDLGGGDPDVDDSLAEAPLDPPADADDVVVPDLVDPFDPVDPLAGTAQALRPTRANFLTVMTIHLCQRAASCGADPVMTQLCQRLSRPSQTRPTRCYHPVKALMCLRAIDSLSCDKLPTMITLQRIPACLELMTC